MANPVSWKQLYRLGTGKAGASFKRVVITPTTPMPYKVNAFERLVIPKMDQPVSIDLSGLTSDDDAFQVYDAGRNFNNNAVLIKANQNLTIADAGKDTTDGSNLDLSLDMVGAGQVWEFVVSSGSLIASDSPGYTGDGAGGSGGGGSTPSPAPTPVSADTDAIVLRGVDHPKSAQFTMPPGLSGGGDRDILYFEFDQPTNKSTAWIWPKNTPAAANFSQWQYILLYDQDDINRYSDAHIPLSAGDGDPDINSLPYYVVGNTHNALYFDKTGGKWWVWPKGKPVKRDGDNFWTSVGNAGGGGGAPVFNQRNFDATGNNPPITAAPGDLLVVNFVDYATDVVDFPITFPTPKADDRPIRVLFTGGLARTPQNNRADVMVRDAEIVITSPVPIIGAWDDFESGDKTLNLDMAGEMAEFSPFTVGGNPAWLITSANYVSEDSHMKVITADYRAAMGDALIVFGFCRITLPSIEREKDLDPITVICNYRPDIVGSDRGGGALLEGIADPNGAQDTIQGKYNGQKLPVNQDSKMGQPTALTMNDGDWVTLTPFKAPTAGAFWLITGCNPN